MNAIADWSPVVADCAKQSVTSFGGEAELCGSLSLAQVPSGCSGSYIMLESSGHVICIGMVAEEQRWHALVAPMLGLEPGEPLGDEFTPEEVQDALNEFVNVLGGMVKRGLNGNLGELTMGLPLYADTPIRVTGMDQKIGYRLVCSGKECHLVVMYGKRPEARML